MNVPYIIQKMLTDIPILIVLVIFLFSIIYCIRNYISVNKNLKEFFAFISNFKKTDLNFRFKEIDEWMLYNPYVTSIWLEFKNTLVFSESVALKGKNNDLTYKEVSSTVQNIQTTVDPLYFFDEEALIKSKYNSKLIASLPTVLTGLGPMFTFLNIAIAFGKLNFTSQEAILSSVSDLMSSMQAAALVSVFAVSVSLIFIMIEKITYNRLCETELNKVQTTISHLFDNISSEKFLFELLKETKIQNNALTNLIAAMPEHFKVALNSGIASNLVPYLENVIFGLNQLNKGIKEVAKSRKIDDVDDLF